MNDFLAHVMEYLAPLGGMSARAMFGGHGIYCHGQIFAIIADGELYFKVGDDNRADYEEAGSHPFQYDGKGKVITMSYWSLPEDVLSDPAQLKQWVRRSLEVSAKSAKKSADPKPRKSKNRAA